MTTSPSRPHPRAAICEACHRGICVRSRPPFDVCDACVQAAYGGELDFASIAARIAHEQRNDRGIRVGTRWYPRWRIEELGRKYSERDT